ncbi:MLO-like protein 1 isoform X2 [Juglans microcarpa x Juglans regia]|uniref:MLO-like protein 1 isoform X2 n=1 Tax=Juglans microcarpa x Juglans regia TaxID=2249226 RepID=UPI001B7DAF16|nr:MLO-like protein 1 isoform X2 [Juglans microcarpa x Juglans regia]
MAGGGEGTTLEYTPTWVVAVVCSVIVLISLVVERTLHGVGKYLKKNNQKPLFEALQKIKEELMLLGFISLLLTVFQDRIAKICISEVLANKWLPCKKEEDTDDDDSSSSSSSTAHFQTFFKYPSFVLPAGTPRRLLAQASASTESCAKIRQWKQWEDSILRKEYDPERVLKTKFTHVQDHDFIRGHYRGFGKDSALLGWVNSFFKQFYGSVTKTEYVTMRLGFIMTHCRGNLQFNFYEYMIRALEADFKKVVGISWYLWLFVVIFLLLNVSGWHTYFWIAFIPFILLLAVGSKLEHVICQLAQEVAEKHVAVEGELVVKPSDDHFWFHRPKLVLLLIHIIMFQNAFELAFFFWTWVQYDLDSCIMGKMGFVIPRLVIGAFIQFVCSYSTLPHYAIVTQMGSSLKKEIFPEHVQEGLVDWAKHAKKTTGLRKAVNGTRLYGSTTTHGSSHVVGRETTGLEVELTEASESETAMEEGKAGEIEHANVSHEHK